MTAYSLAALADHPAHKLRDPILDLVSSLPPERFGVGSTLRHALSDHFEARGDDYRPPHLDTVAFRRLLAESPAADEPRATRPFSDWDPIELAAYVHPWVDSFYCVCACRSHHPRTKANTFDQQASYSKTLENDWVYTPAMPLSRLAPGRNTVPFLAKEYAADRADVPAHLDYRRAMEAWWADPTVRSTLPVIVTRRADGRHCIRDGWHRIGMTATMARAAGITRSAAVTIPAIVGTPTRFQAAPQLHHPEWREQR